MSYAADLQKARKQREAEDGPLASDEIVRYTCGEKYELGAANCVPPNGSRVEFFRATDPRREMEAPDLEKFQPGMIETYTGDTYYFEHPDPTHIHLADIAHALSNHCRYAGHTKRFYSVGEHSLLVRNILRAQGYGVFMQLKGLFHDGHETYVMDAPSPLKPLLGEAFRNVALLSDNAIAKWLNARTAYVDFSPSGFETPKIKLADRMALVYERQILMTADRSRWENGYEDVPDLPDDIENYYGGFPKLGWMDPTIIENRFIEAAHELGVDE